MAASTFVSVAGPTAASCPTRFPVPSNEPDRLAALRRYEILDTPPEPAFDRITRLASAVFQVPIVRMALLDADRQWIKSCVGPHLQDPSRELAFCTYTILQDEVMVVPDTSCDPRFQDHPFVVGAPHIRFYAGAPLHSSEGFLLGTLCLIDTAPRPFSAAQAATLADLAAVLSDELALHLATITATADAAESRQLAAVLRRSEEELEQRGHARTAELQAALRENSRLAAAIDSAATGILICDARQPDTPIIFVNPAFCAITGYAREEVIGRNCRFLQGPGTDPAVLAEIRAARDERRAFRGVLRNYRKDGKPFWIGLTISPVFDEAGELINFVGVQADLSDRVEALEQARQSEARLALAQRVAHLGSWEQIFSAGKRSSPIGQSL